MRRCLAIFVLFAPALLQAQQAGQVPAYLLQLPESVDTVLIAETTTSTLHIFVPGDAGPQLQDQSYMSVGQNGVGKQRAWDRKTPLGIYFVNEQLDTTRMHKTYGPTAFPLDYPNVWDRINRRSGDGIWIHGVTPNAGRRPPLDTDGCIALPNDKLLALEERLMLLRTPVVVTRAIRWVSTEQLMATRSELMGVLQEWRAGYESGDLHQYLSMYADDFGYRGMTRDEWAAYRTQSITMAPALNMVLDDVMLMADPENDDLYLSRFRQQIAYADRTIVTLKRLYWRRSTAGELKIVAEDNG